MRRCFGWIGVINCLNIKFIHCEQRLSNNSSINSTVTDVAANDVIKLLSDPQFLLAAGGSGLTVICFILLVVVLCILSNLKKGIKNLEAALTSHHAGVQQQTSTISNSSNYADDVDTIPRVPRRSEYIRQKVVTELQNWKKRVSRTLPLFATPRSSADTFDLGKREDPIYDDITNCRPAAADNFAEKGCCWCLCCRGSEYKKTRTSDLKSIDDCEKKVAEKADENEQPVVIENIVEERTYHDKKEIIKNKKRQKEIEQNSNIEVNHFEFDGRENQFQPKTTDDITIKGNSPKNIKRVNKEHALQSFGKSSTVSNKPELSNKPPTQVVHENAPPQKSTKPRIPHHGIQLPIVNFPVRCDKSLPSVNEEPSEEASSTSESSAEKERDPSYIDMSQTRKQTPP